MMNEVYERWQAPVSRAFDAGKRIFTRTLLRIQSTLGRIGGIAAGTVIMGPYDFLSFYFVHMFLRSLIVLFSFDTDVNVTQTIRKHQKIGIGHFTFLHGCNAILVIPILLFYLTTIEIFDHFVTPGFINLDFAYMYTLIAFATILLPLDGVIRGSKNVLARTLVLRGTNILTVVLIVPFLLFGIDPDHLPYVWVCSAAITLVMSIGVGLYMLVSRIDLSSWKAPPGQTYKDVLQAVVDYGASTTRNRAIMIIVRGLVAIILGPFAGMTLSAFQFGDQNNRRKYLSKFKDRKLFRKMTKRAKSANIRTPSFFKWATANDRPLYFLVLVACTIAFFIYAMRDSASAIILLGMLVVASKMFGISLRIIVLTILGSGQSSDIQDEEEVY